MSGLDTMIKTILDEASAEAQAILDHAQEDAARILEEAAAATNLECERIVQESRQKAESILQMAQAAGVDAIAVTYGAHPADALRSANSLACFDNVEVLGNWLMQNLHQPSRDPTEFSKAS